MAPGSRTGARLGGNVIRRDHAIGEAAQGRPYDFLIIGGGASGLGTATDAAARGYRTLVVDQHDFAKATSSRSTKLIHGGVRYLKQGKIGLVRESLRERGLLCRNAPHLVHHLPFLVPIYTWWHGPYYGIGLKLYDRLAGELGLTPSKTLSRAEALGQIPTLKPEGLRKGVQYRDSQFDDSRLAVNLAQTVVDMGGSAINYMKVTRFLKTGGRLKGAVLQDQETGNEYEVKARCVINATGIFTDEVRALDQAGAQPLITASQGAHVVLPKSFLPGQSALMVPKTPDGRILFAIPWRDYVLVGTTDVPVDTVSLEPTPLEEEIDFILSTAAGYLNHAPERSDVLSAFAGLRPLVKTGSGKSTASLSREHTILTSDSGLVTVTGGKWTTYRKMAQDVMKQAERVAGVEPRPCPTAQLRIHGWTDAPSADPVFGMYGCGAEAVERLAREDPALAEKLHPDLPYTAANVVWAVREEMARTVEDVLSRRTRALILNAQASVEAAPKVAKLLAAELGHDETWTQRAAGEYEKLAAQYLL
ncbi:MAG: FAD-dependent oxidoreductase, partial [Candidatus Hydrogenedentota bacterium]